MIRALRVLIAVWPLLTIVAVAVAQQPVAGLSVVTGPNAATVTIDGCCTIHQDGTVELREGLKLDDASRAFWAAISQFGMRNCRPVEGTKP